ncbi:MAG: site-specific integrase [Syntrophales bacterium]
MALYKRGLVWWMSFTHNGEQHRQSTETEDKTLAKRIFDKVKGQIAEGKWFEKLPGEDYTFGDLMKKYMAEYSAVEKAASSHKRDKSLSDHLIKVFGDNYLTDIKPAMVSNYKTQRRGEGASPRTIQYELTLMNHAFNLAIMDWEWIDVNPLKKVKKEKVNNSIERWLTQKEEEQLLKASPKWLQEMILFAINTGFRQSEILDLKWSQIDLERKTVTISEQKNKGVDTLPLNEAALDVLREKGSHAHNADDLVFPTGQNTRFLNRNVFRMFVSATEKVKIKKLRFHDLRHTFATRLVQNGVDIYTVQKLGRWKSIKMVERYSHHNVESLRSGIQVMDRVNKSGVITNLSQSQKKRGHKPLLRLATP